jgi:hypothetical protein
MQDKLSENQNTNSRKCLNTYTGGGKWPQEKWVCDFHDDAKPLSLQLQVTEDFFKIS